MKIFLAPHNDDETLFGAFTCQAEKPLVVVCLRSYKQEAQGIKYYIREAETEAACEVLGCEWLQWTISDIDPDWDLMREQLLGLDLRNPSEVFAPAYDFERNGWSPTAKITGYGLYHHDKIGQLAEEVFGERVFFYQTYSRWHGKVEEGTEVLPTAEQIVGKLTALSKYQSQIEEMSTRHHFLGSFREWWA